jgi:RHS repeat-associated protein
METIASLMTSKGFIGERNDENGLVYLHARYLYPALGLFLTPDPSPDPTAPGVGLNRYAYAGNNPISTVDSSGLEYLGETAAQRGYDDKHEQHDGEAAAAGLASAVGALEDMLTPGQVARLGLRVNPWGAVIAGVALALTPTEPALDDYGLSRNGYLSEADGAPAQQGSTEEQGSPTPPEDDLLTPPHIDVRWHQHHSIPKAIQKQLPPEVADDPRIRGCRGCPNKVRIPEPVHKDIHRGPAGGPYNAEFKNRLDILGGPPSVDDVLRIRDQLMKDFDLDRYRP